VEDLSIVVFLFEDVLQAVRPVVEGLFWYLLPLRFFSCFATFTVKRFFDLPFLDSVDKHCTLMRKRSFRPSLDQHFAFRRSQRLVSVGLTGPLAGICSLHDISQFFPPFSSCVGQFPNLDRCEPPFAIACLGFCRTSDCFSAILHSI